MGSRQQRHGRLLEPVQRAPRAPRSPALPAPALAPAGLGPGAAPGVCDRRIGGRGPRPRALPCVSGQSRLRDDAGYPSRIVLRPEAALSIPTPISFSLHFCFDEGTIWKPRATRVS